MRVLSGAAVAVEDKYPMRGGSKRLLTNKTLDETGHTYTRGSEKGMSKGAKIEIRLIVLPSQTFVSLSCKENIYVKDRSCLATAWMSRAAERRMQSLHRRHDSVSLGRQNSSGAVIQRDKHGQQFVERVLCIKTVCGREMMRVRVRAAQREQRLTAGGRVSVQ